MSSYFIGVDIGTTSTKAVAFSVEGSTIAHHSIGYSIQHAHPDWSEQDPDEIVRAVIEAIQTVQISSQPYGSLQGISFSAAMHSLMAVDEQGIPLTKLIIWADNRAATIANTLKATATGKQLYHATGTPIHAMTPLCKLLWIKENDPALHQKAYKFIGIKEYVFFHFFGKFLIDQSLASATGLLDIQTLQWHSLAMQTAGLAPEKLSQLVSIFHIENCPPEWAAKLTIPARLPFVIGASDGCLANVGTGAVTPDRMAVTIGTSGAVRTGISQPWTDEHMRTFCYVLTRELFVVGGGMNNGGIVAEWLQKNLFDGPDTEDFDHLLDLAQTVAAGAEGLLFLPYLLGERAPIYNAHAKGVYFGITIQHTRAHFIRATLEGIALAVYHTGKALLDRFPEIETLSVGGGFARSGFLVQLLADVFGKKAIISETVESSAYGAVLVGRKAISQLDNWQKTVAMKATQTFEPDAKRHLVYQQSFGIYTRLYQVLEPEFFL